MNILDITHQDHTWKKVKKLNQLITNHLFSIVGNLFLLLFFLLALLLIALLLVLVLLVLLVLLLILVLVLILVVVLLWFGILVKVFFKQNPQKLQYIRIFTQGYIKIIKWNSPHLWRGRSQLSNNCYFNWYFQTLLVFYDILVLILTNHGIYWLIKKIVVKYIDISIKFICCLTIPEGHATWWLVVWDSPEPPSNVWTQACTLCSGSSPALSFQWDPHRQSDRSRKPSKSTCQMQPWADCVKLLPWCPE